MIRATWVGDLATRAFGEIWVRMVDYSPADVADIGARRAIDRDLRDQQLRIRWRTADRFTLKPEHELSVADGAKAILSEFDDFATHYEVLLEAADRP